jgi:hypothetical protein
MSRAASCSVNVSQARISVEGAEVLGGGAWRRCLAEVLNGGALCRTQNYLSSNQLGGLWKYPAFLYVLWPPIGRTVAGGRRVKPCDQLAPQGVRKRHDNKCTGGRTRWCRCTVQPIEAALARALRGRCAAAARLVTAPAPSWRLTPARQTMIWSNTDNTNRGDRTNTQQCTACCTTSPPGKPCVLKITYIWRRRTHNRKK